MGYAFADLAFTPHVKAHQEAAGSRASYARRERGPTLGDRLGPREAAFIADRDSFYMATVSETGWPYVQHRGGPRGFVEVVDERTLRFADLSGNRQYVTVGNLDTDDRVSLFFMDYANRTRLKLLGRARTLPAPAPVDGRGARVERLMEIRVEALDWNCPQHITPRYTLPEIETAVAPLRQRIAELEAALAATGAPAAG